jgi:rod shape-determining protein MreD
MVKRVVWGVVFILAAALLQSTVFSRLAIYVHAVPDLALCILVFSAYVNGTMTGQLTGFFSGFLLDMLSSAPLGFNSLVRTLLGALSGLIKGTFYLDIFFLPMALCAGATVLKALIYYFLHLLFSGAVPVYVLTGYTFWVELGMNTFIAPLLFAFLKLFGSLLAAKSEKD